MYNKKLRKRGKKYDNYPQAADYAVATLLTALALAFTFFGLMPEGALKVRAEDTHTYTDSYGTWTYSILDEGTARIISFRISSTNPTSITIPSKVDDYTVTNLYLRFYNTIIQRVTIPNTVTSIDRSYLFSNCTSLNTVTLSNSITSIPDYTFYKCSSLTTLSNFSTNSKLTSIGMYAFAYCTALESITMPNSVTTLGNSTFYCCEVLESVTLSNSLTSIPDYAFDVCTNLKAIYIPDGVTRIGEGTFGDNENFNTIFIPSSVTFIASNAFSKVNALDIIGYNGSLAETYASENSKIAFVTADSLFDDVTYNLKPKKSSSLTKPEVLGEGVSLSGVAAGTTFAVAPSSEYEGKVVSECKNYYLITITPLQRHH